MNVFIARDGEIIGEYPQAQIAHMARNCQLLPDDHYWQEGMEDWLPLPDLVGAETWEKKAVPVPPPLEGPRFDMRVLVGGAALLLLLLLLGFLLIKPDVAEPQQPIVQKTSVPNASSASEARDKAAAALQKKLDRLPAEAQPPLNVFYEGKLAHMNKTLSDSSPWTTSIHAWENVVEPGSQKILTRTEFTLEADYEDGDWVFRRYTATINNLKSGTVSRIDIERDTGTPPAIVTLMGFRIDPPAVRPPPLSTDENSRSPTPTVPPPIRPPSLIPARPNRQ